MAKKLSEFEKAKHYFSQKHEQEKDKLKRHEQVKKGEQEEYKKKVEEYFKLKKEELQEKEANLKRER
jgi:hypothetical protein